MKLFGYELRRAETRSSPENINVPVSAENFLQYFGIKQGNLPIVTIDSALQVPAVAAAVNFLSSTLASLPLHVYKSVDGAAERAGGPLQRILNEAPNSEWTSFGLRKYLWQQVYTGGRGLAYIERSGTNIVGIWPMDPSKTTVSMSGGRRFYKFEGQDAPYAASDVIDLPFMLKRDQVSSYSPITLGEKAIQLALAMNEYGSGFFAGGGVPPLAVEGPPPAGKEAMLRAYNDIQRAIEVAREANIPITNLPGGYKLTAIGFDPEKGQMTEARLFQVQEIGRVYDGLPPAFLQDLSKGTFSNTEQQDLHLAKHVVTKRAIQLEDELNLKLFGAKRNVRYVEHSVDGLMRGAFKDRIEALARGVQSALLTPDEARALDNRPPKPNGDKLYIQGATVELGSQPKEGASAPPVDGGQDDDGTS